MTGQFEEMVTVCADVLTVGARLSNENDLPSAAVVRQRMAGLFDSMTTRARLANIAERDIVDARYALCAFVDEQVLKAVWSDRQAWISDPLQLLYFGENSAGDGFYSRLAVIESDPNRRHVLEIYYLCLALGFRGRIGLRQAGTVEALLARLHGDLEDEEPSPNVLSCHGTAPDVPMAPTSYTSLWATVFMIMLGAGVVFLALRSELQLEIMTPVGEIGSIARSVALRAELDSDYDGVPDARDTCPFTPEDFDGATDQDGCPEVGGAPAPTSPVPPKPAKVPVKLPAR